MSYFRSVLLVLLASFSVSMLHAQVPKDPTTWKFEAKKVGDGKYNIIAHLSLAEHWHIYSLDPKGDGLEIPPKMTFDQNPLAKPAGAMKEAGKKITGAMDGVDGIVSYFMGNVTYTQSFLVKGNTTIHGTFAYQVCDDHMCLPTKNKKFTLEITDAGVVATTTDTASKIATTAVPPTDTAAGKGSTAAAPVAAAPVSKDTAAKPAAGKDDIGLQSNGMLFAEGMGFGLASVITPCVFAMLPMTVSFFLKRSKDRKTGIKIALQYSLSIILIFTAIGALFAVFFKPDDLHAFSTHWIVNLFFFVVFIAFGLSFLGAFEINLPSSWATKMDSKANTKNLAGIFFMALTLVIVSFSCTGPFISSMISLMGKGGKVGPLIGFFGFGLGLALPFSLFAIFPSLLNELGKSGGWLNVVKVTFGFVELALALKFLSNADLQKGWRLLDREIFVAMWVGLSFLLAMYLLGVFRFSHDSEMPKNDWGLPYLKVPRFIFAAAAVIFGFYMLPGMWGCAPERFGRICAADGHPGFCIGQGSECSGFVNKFRWR